ncbi:SRPBCC family protein [Salana multivorans]
MTTPSPTGRLVEGPDGLDLVLTRTLPGTVDEAWAGITDPERTARWFGRWEGDGAPGERIRIQMGFEENAPWVEATIVGCNPPRLLRLLTHSDHGSWDLALEVLEAGGRTELRFVHHGVSPGEVGDVGPGWEYYLDLLVASTTDAPMPGWDDYFPAQREYFQRQVP